MKGQRRIRAQQRSALGNGARWFSTPFFTWSALAFACLLLYSSPTLATGSVFQQAFQRQSAVMLLIEPITGLIVDANPAAQEFYGYGSAELQNMRINDINVFTDSQIKAEISAATQEKRNFFVFRHELANGELKKVHVNIAPIMLNGQSLLYAIVRDASNTIDEASRLEYQRNLEAAFDQQSQEIAAKTHTIILTLTGILTILVVSVGLLSVGYRKLLMSKKTIQGNEATLESIFNSLSDSLIFTDIDDQIIKINKNGLSQFQCADSDIQQRPVSKLLAHNEPPSGLSAEAFKEDNKFRTLRYQKHDGQIFYGETNASVITSPDGSTLGYVRVIRDITQRLMAQNRLKLAASFFNNTSEGILLYCGDGSIQECNEAFCTLLGLEKEQVVSQHIGDYFSSFLDQDYFAHTASQLKQHGRWQDELTLQRPKRSALTVSMTITSVHNRLLGHSQYVMLFHDITKQKIQQHRLQQVAHYDALTGIANRLLLGKKLQEGLAQAEVSGQYLAVAYIDLDGFKQINDTWGHEVGDQLLVKLAMRMQGALRSSDTLARLGGDEFVAVLTNLPSAQHPCSRVSKLLQAAADCIDINGEKIKVTASIGITFSPQSQGPVEADTLLRQADHAMYQAKLKGKGGCQAFDHERARALKGKQEGLVRFKQAIQNDELLLYYQPKVNMHSGEVFGVEALIRWQHPDRGLVPPIAFLPMIEDHALFLELGDWVIDAALKQTEQWHQQGCTLSTSINVGSRQLLQADFLDKLAEALKRVPNVPSTAIELELLESSVINDLQHVSETIKACQALGVSFSLDDFGTGYSSLSYLRHLPAECLKVDRSFVMNILSEEEDVLFLKGIVDLAQVFNRSVIAEGVETVDHGRKLLSLGISLAQGFGIARPMPAEQVLDWVKTWEPPAAWKAPSLAQQRFSA